MFLVLGLRLSLFPEWQFLMRDCYSLAELFLGELFPRGFFQRVNTKSFDPIYSRDMADSTSCHHFAEQAVTRWMMRSLYL